jgi:curved DNA-binding protein CbpA
MERPFSLYADLRLPPDAPPATVEWAYRKLMKRHHPDHAGPGSGSRAAEINAAYSILRDPDRRAAYDRREQARQHALRAAEANSFARRRRIVRGGSWMAAAIALGAGIPLGANWYNEGIVPQRSATAAAAARPAAEAVPPVRDPIEHVADFLRTQIHRPAVRASAPPKPPAAALEHAPRVAAAVRSETPMKMRRSAPPPRPAAQRAADAAEADFLEREGFIY